MPFVIHWEKFRPYFSTQGLAHWLTFVEHQYFPPKSRTFVQLSKVSLMPSKIKEKGKIQDLKSFEDSCSITLQTSLCFGLVRKLVDSSEHGSFKTTCPFLHVLAHPCVKSTWSSGHEHSPFIRQVPRFVMLQTESSPKWQDIPLKNNYPWKHTTRPIRKKCYWNWILWMKKKS